MYMEKEILDNFSPKNKGAIKAIYINFLINNGVPVFQDFITHQLISNPKLKEPLLDILIDIL